MTGGALGAAGGSLIPSKTSFGPVGSNVLYGALGGALIGGVWDYTQGKSKTPVVANVYVGDGFTAMATNVPDEFISPYLPHNRIKVTDPFSGKIVADGARVFKLP